MAVLFNNLIINKNSERYKPFLVNLISGRRKMLNDNEFNMICSMLGKGNVEDFTDEEGKFYLQMEHDKQFVSDEQREIIEEKMMESGMFDINYEPTDNLDFSIKLTHDCNMNCSYCFEKDMRNSSTISKEQIDAIYNFFEFCKERHGANGSISTINITGGEPLINQNCVDMINYIASKWSDAKIEILTNGVNLLKYYDKLPLGQFEKVRISLDGLKETHMDRRYSGAVVSGEIYDDIILGIKKLINDRVKVKIQTVLDKSNYEEYPKLRKFLIDEGILGSVDCTISPDVVMDFKNQLDIDENFNDRHDVMKIQEFLLKCEGSPWISFFGLGKLWEMIRRPKNEPFTPKHNFCNSQFLKKCYFAPDGNVYFCMCTEEGRGTIGTYYPETSINHEAIRKLTSRSVMNHEKCSGCPYKFICVGHCPKSSEAKGEEMTCGVFADSEIMDNLEYHYHPQNQPRR